MHPIVPLLSVNLFVTAGSHKTDIDHVIFGVTFKTLGCTFRLFNVLDNQIRDGFIVQSLITVIW